MKEYQFIRPGGCVVILPRKDQRSSASIGGSSSWMPPDWQIAERRARLSRAQRKFVILNAVKDLRGRISLSARARDLLFGFSAIALLLFLSWLIVRFP